MTLFTPELLAPAGDMEKFQTAVLYGANAVYLGGTVGNLRATTKGFTPKELQQAVTFAKMKGIKIYYCLNAMPFERDMASIPGTVEEAANAGVHAFIVADPGVLRVARRLARNIPVHLSTQANTTNAESIRFWTDAGVERIVLARELSHRDIRTIRNLLPKTELEVFVHGAMCLAVSGQCLLSAWLNNRPANQGRCTQPCRFDYRVINADIPPSLALEEALRSGETLWSVEQQEDFAAIFAPNDLCLLPFLPWFVKNAITSLKIEGRAKGSSYVAHVTDAYRVALDAATRCVTEGTSFDSRLFLPDLIRTASRPLSTGFFLSRRRPVCGEAEARPLLGRIVEPQNEARGAWIVDIRGKWEETYSAEIMLPGLRRPVLPPGTYTLENHRGERTGHAASGTRAILHAEIPEAVSGVFIRRT